MRVHNVAAQGTSRLTSNSWGISRRARYSLASLVFISSRISTEIATYPKPFLMPSNVSAPSDNLWWTDEQDTGFPSAHFCLVCGLHQIPAGDATSPASWCGCVARPSSLLPRFANSAHHVCLALALRVCHKKPKQNHQNKRAPPLLRCYHSILKIPAWELGSDIQAWLIALQRALNKRYETFGPAALIWCLSVYNDLIGGFSHTEQ